MTETMYRHCGDRVAVQWLQGDEHHFVILVRRLELTD